MPARARVIASSECVQFCFHLREARQLLTRISPSRRLLLLSSASTLIKTYGLLYVASHPHLVPLTPFMSL